MKSFASLKKMTNRFKIVFLQKSRGEDYLLYPSVLATIVVVSLLPFALLWCQYSYEKSRSEKIDAEVKRLEDKTLFLVQVYQNRERFLQKFGKADRDYIQRYLEPTVFLEEDIALMEKILKNETKTFLPGVINRVNFLKGSDNKLSFTESVKRNSDYYQEREWRANHPVQVDCEDIKKLLTLVEGVKIEGHIPNPFRPQLFIKKFHVKRLDSLSGAGVFSLDLEILQREGNEKNL